MVHRTTKLHEYAALRGYELPPSDYTNPALTEQEGCCLSTNTEPLFLRGGGGGGGGDTESEVLLKGPRLIYTALCRKPQPHKSLSRSTCLQKTQRRP